MIIKNKKKTILIPNLKHLYLIEINPIMTVLTKKRLILFLNNNTVMFKKNMYKKDIHNLHQKEEII